MLDKKAVLNGLKIKTIHKKIIEEDKKNNKITIFYN